MDSSSEATNRLRRMDRAIEFGEVTDRLIRNTYAFYNNSLAKTAIHFNMPMMEVAFIVDARNHCKPGWNTPKKRK